MRPYTWTDGLFISGIELALISLSISFIMLLPKKNLILKYDSRHMWEMEKIIL